MTLPPAVVVRSLRVRRSGQLVLGDITLDVPAGRVVGLLGPSGSGKTTLMRSIAGLQRIESGEVIVLGAPAGAAATRGRVGYLTQDHAVYTDLSVAENLRFFAALAGVHDRVEGAIARTRLDGLESRLAGRLSGGQRARVALASVLVSAPPLLVLDEPTVGLDPVLRGELWELFRELAAGGAAILVSSHVMDEADRCDEIVLLRDGRILARGTPAELRARTGAESIEDAFLRLVAA
jgi:ABC-2 type transport system ATP-binding protein